MMVFTCDLNTDLIKFVPPSSSFRNLTHSSTVWLIDMCYHARSLNVAHTLKDPFVFMPLLLSVYTPPYVHMLSIYVPCNLTVPPIPHPHATYIPH